MGKGGERHWNKTITEGYLISRYPITNAQFGTFVEAGGYRERRYWVEAKRAKVWKDGLVKLSSAREINRLKLILGYARENICKSGWKSDQSGSKSED